MPGRNYTANGSILLPVDVDRGSALDYSKQASSECLKIVESNREVPSTVPDSVAFASGGKSDPDSSVKATSSKPDVLQGTQPKEPAARANGASTSSETSAQVEVTVSGDAAGGVEAGSAAGNGSSVPEESPGTSGNADSSVEDVPQPVAKVAQEGVGE